MARVCTYVAGVGLPSSGRADPAQSSYFAARSLYVSSMGLSVVSVVGLTFSQWRCPRSSLLPPRSGIKGQAPGRRDALNVYPQRCTVGTFHKYGSACSRSRPAPARLVTLRAFCVLGPANQGDTSAGAIARTKALCRSGFGAPALDRVTRVRPGSTREAPKEGPKSDQGKGREFPG
jgi:hypothetical protein